MELYELRKELLDDAEEYLRKKYKIQKCFAKMTFQQLVKSGQKLETEWQKYMPPMHTIDDIVALAKQMETYVLQGNSTTA